MQKESFNHRYYRTISHLIKLFILPEIEKRLREKIIKENDLPFELAEFRISQRKESNGTISPIVELNDEVRLEAKMKPKRAISAGQIVTLDDIYPEDCYLEPPKYDGKPAGYFYVRAMTFGFLLIFDCKPNIPSAISEKDLEESRMPFPILDVINAINLKEHIKPYEKMEMLCRSNWPPAPGYYPNVFMAMDSDPTIINRQDLVQIAEQSFDKAYWERQMFFWKERQFFPNRLQYLDRALKAHFEHDYISSIHILVPQFEGIVKDYLSSCGKIPPRGFVDCVRELRDMIKQRKIMMFPKPALEPMFDYLENGTFWKDTTDISDPRNTINRHGIVHGIFTGFENQDISLKYLILLDSLAFIILHDRILSYTI